MHLFSEIFFGRFIRNGKANAKNRTRPARNRVGSLTSEFQREKSHILMKLVIFKWLRYEPATRAHCGRNMQCSLGMLIIISELDMHISQCAGRAAHRFALVCRPHDQPIKCAGKKKIWTQIKQPFSAIFSFIYDFCPKFVWQLRATGCHSISSNRPDMASTR